MFDFESQIVRYTYLCLIIKSIFNYEKNLKNKKINYYEMLNNNIKLYQNILSIISLLYIICIYNNIDN